MTRNAPLFRAAALAARRQIAAGAIVLWQPRSVRVGTWLAISAAAGLLALLVLGAYTRHATVRGWLVPDRGLIGVTAELRGTESERLVAEGDAVEAGQLLFVVSAERVTVAEGAAHAQIGARLAVQRHGLVEQRARLESRRRLERETVERQLTALAEELASIEAMIAAQRERLALARAADERYSSVQARGFGAAEQAAARRELVLEHLSRLRALERELAGKRSAAAELEGRARMLDLRYSSEAAELERSILGTEAQSIENEARRELAVLAPRAGTVSTVLAEEGQVVEAGAALAFVVPQGAQLRAELYAPSRVVGFIEPGAEVLLRFPAFPYQRFGHQRGRVIEVSRSALTAAELPRRRVEALAGAEALYRVVVALDRQHVETYGVERPLLADMVVEADVLQERRKLYEWVLDPVYALTGKLH